MLFRHRSRSITHQHDQTPLYSTRIVQSIKKRIKQLIGLGLIIASLFLIVLIILYDPSASSWNTVISGRQDSPDTLIDYSIHIVDLLVQLFGVVALFLMVEVIVLSWQFGFRQDREISSFRCFFYTVLFCIFGVIAVSLLYPSMQLSTEMQLPTDETRTFHSGGAIGFLLAREISDFATAPWAQTIIGTMSALITLPTLWMMGQAMGWFDRLRYAGKTIIPAPQNTISYSQSRDVDHYRHNVLSFLETLPLSAEPNQPDLDHTHTLSLLEKTLNDFGIYTQTTIQVKCSGPVVTLYQLDLIPGIKATRLIQLAPEIAQYLNCDPIHITTISWALTDHDRDTSSPESDNFPLLCGQD